MTVLFIVLVVLVVFLLLLLMLLLENVADHLTDLKLQLAGIAVCLIN